ncbi:helix-turn-helix domain-containing protein [Azospirillum sp. HJ39]|nr:helix-turn-helix domain-containing protein [Azospirillum thiophilum]
MAKPVVPLDPADRRDWVVSALRRRGSSMRQIAFQIGVCPQAVAQALHLPSARIEAALAQKLDLAVQDLFPERYRADGTRLCRTRPPDRKAA